MFGLTFNCFPIIHLSLSKFVLACSSNLYLLTHSHVFSIKHKAFHAVLYTVRLCLGNITLSKVDLGLQDQTSHSMPKYKCNHIYGSCLKVLCLENFFIYINALSNFDLDLVVTV